MHELTYDELCTVIDRFNAKIEASLDARDRKAFHSSVVGRNKAVTQASLMVDRSDLEVEPR